MCEGLFRKRVQPDPAGLEPCGKLGSMGHVRPEVEARVASLLELGDAAEAAEALVVGYGAEILGYLTVLARDEHDARDAFGDFCEALMRGLSGFEGRSTARVWAFTVARHAALRHLSAPHRRRDRNIPLSQVTALSAVAERVRTETEPYLRTEHKERLAMQRAELSEEDRTLLVLRVDKRLEWQEVAAVMLGTTAADEALRKEAARLRKRFQLLKERLRDAGVR